MRKVLHYAIALWKAPVGPAVTALLGLILTAVFLLVFASDLSLILEINIDDLIASFIVCGLGAGLGFILLRRLFPQRGPISLFGDSGVPIPCVTETNTPVHAAEHSQAVKEQATHQVRPGSHIKPVMLGHGSESPATLNTHQSPGIALAATIIGMTLIVAGRFDFGWQFTSLALLAGGAMAVVLYWVRRQPQNSSIWSYAVPVSGGLIGSAAMGRRGHDALSFPAAFSRIGGWRWRCDCYCAAVSKQPDCYQLACPACCARSFSRYNSN